MNDKPPKRPRDPAQLAKLMIDIASGEVSEGQPTAKESRARKAGTKGGPARAKALTQEQRQRDKAMDYAKFYHLERYLLEEVGPQFRSSGTIDPVDLFMI